MISDIKLELQQNICKYILYKLGIPKNLKVENSLLNEIYFINNIDIFEDEEPGSLFGIKSKIQNSDINIYCCSLNDDLYVVFVNISDLPEYALVADSHDHCIYIKASASDWTLTDTFLQASFLAGMERLNDLNPLYSKAEKDKFNLNSLKQIIMLNEIKNER